MAKNTRVELVMTVIKTAAADEVPAVLKDGKVITPAVPAVAEVTEIVRKDFSAILPPEKIKYLFQRDPAPSENEPILRALDCVTGLFGPKFMARIEDPAVAATHFEYEDDDFESIAMTPKMMVARLKACGGILGPWATFKAAYDAAVKDLVAVTRKKKGSGTTTSGAGKVSSNLESAALSLLDL